MTELLKCLQENVSQGKKLKESARIEEHFLAKFPERISGDFNEKNDENVKKTKENARIEEHFLRQRERWILA